MAIREQNWSTTAKKTGTSGQNARPGTKTAWESRDVRLGASAGPTGAGLLAAPAAFPWQPAGARSAHRLVRRLSLSSRVAVIIRTSGRTPPASAAATWTGHAYPSGKSGAAWQT